LNGSSSYFHTSHSENKGGNLSSGTDVIHCQNSSWILRSQAKHILKFGMRSLHADRLRE